MYQNTQSTLGKDLLTCLAFFKLSNSNIELSSLVYIIEKSKVIFQLIYLTLLLSSFHYVVYMIYDYPDLIGILIIPRLNATIKS